MRSLTAVSVAFGLVLGSLSSPAIVPSLAAQAAAFTNPSSQTAEAQIYRTWLKYLASKRGNLSDCYTPTIYWAAAEQAGRCYDLALSFANEGTTIAVQSIRPTDASRKEYRVVLDAKDKNASTTSTKSWWSPMKVTLYVVKENNSWVFSGALSRNVAKWRQVKVGPITYVIQPGHAFDVEDARRTLKWTDSIADAFGVPHLTPLTYYLTLSIDDVYGIMGLESEVKYGPGGGNAKPGLIFSGTPSQGAGYKHELMHNLMSPITMSKPTTYLLGEGLATWVGGTSGMSYRQSIAGLGQYLREHPTVTLDSIMMQELKSFTPAQIYPTGALLIDMAFEAGGVAAVKEALTSSMYTHELRTTLPKVLRKSWPQIVSDWKTKALAMRAP